MILSPTACKVFVDGRDDSSQIIVLYQQKISDFLELMKSELCFKTTTISGLYFICYWDVKLKSQIIHPYQANPKKTG